MPFVSLLLTVTVCTDVPEFPSVTEELAAAKDMLDVSSFVIVTTCGFVPVIEAEPTV